MGVQENVDIKATADTNAALTALQQINANLEKLQQTASRTSEKTESMFDGAIAGAAQFTAGIAGVGSATAIAMTAIQAANRYLEDHRANLKAAADAQTLFADAQRRFAGTLGGQSVESGTARILSIAKRTGVTPSAAALAGETLMSAKGPVLGNEQAFAALETAAGYRPGPTTSAAELGAIGSAILSIQKGEPGATAEGSMAFIQEALRAARVTDIESFSTNLLPSIVKAKAYGGNKDSLKYLASMGIAVGQRADDPTGKRTGTGFEGFLRQVQAATVAQLGTDASVEQRMAWLHSTPEGEKVRKSLLGPMYGKNDTDVMSMLQSGGSEMDQMRVGLYGADHAMKLHGETKTLVPTIELLQPGDNVTKQLMAGAFRDVPDLYDPSAVSILRAREKELNRSKYQSVARASRALDSTTASLEVNDPNGAAGLLRDKFDKVMQRSGVGWIDRTLGGYGLESDAYSKGTSLDTLEAMQSQVQRRQVWMSVAGMHSGGMSENQDRVYQELKDLNANLREQIEMMKSVRFNGDESDRNQNPAALRAGQ